MVKEVNYLTPYHWELLRFWREKYEYPIKLIPSYLKKTDKLLDIGCGDGKLTSLLANLVRTVYGIDNQARALAFSRILISNKNVILIKADATVLPFGNNEFDVIIAFDLIEHLSLEKRVEFILEVKRVLKVNGIFILTTPNRNNLRDLFWGKLLKSPYHYEEFNLDELRNFLLQHGFDIVREEGIYLPIPIPYIEHYARVVPFVYFFLILIPLGRICIRISETFLFVTKNRSDK